jgi:hypothetical protein
MGHDDHEGAERAAGWSLSTSEFSNFSLKIISARLLQQGASD